MAMSALKDRLQADLTDRDARPATRSPPATIRMVLTAITNEEVAGKQARELTDDDVLTVLTREAKKRRESAEAYDAARPARAGRRASAPSSAVLARYLPEQLAEDDVPRSWPAAVAEVPHGCHRRAGDGRGHEAGPAAGEGHGPTAAVVAGLVKAGAGPLADSRGRRPCGFAGALSAAAGCRVGVVEV